MANTTREFKTIVQILRNSLEDIWNDLWLMLACNLFWLCAWLLVIPGPPASLALSKVGNRIAHGEVVDLKDFWETFRHEWGVAWRWGGIFLAVLLVLVANLVITGSFQTSWKPYLQGLYLFLIICWLILQIFVLPFLWEQEKMSVRQALHNSWAFILGNPEFAILLSILLILIYVLGTIAFLLSVIFGGVFAACVGNRAVINRLEIYQKSHSEV